MLRVLHGKVEEVSMTDKVDVLVSEPMGTLLVNERMLETYLYARDHFLKPGGKMFPQVRRWRSVADALQERAAGAGWSVHVLLLCGWVGGGCSAACGAAQMWCMVLALGGSS